MKGLIQFLGYLFLFLVDLTGVIVIYEPYAFGLSLRWT